MSIYAFGLPSMFSGSSKGKGFKFSLQTTEDFELLPIAKAYKKN